MILFISVTIIPGFKVIKIIPGLQLIKKIQLKCKKTLELWRFPLLGVIVKCLLVCI